MPPDPVPGGRDGEQIPPDHAAPPVPYTHPFPGDPSTQPSAPAPEIEPPAPRPRRRWGLIVLSSLLGLALIGAIAGGVWLYLQLSDAKDLIDEQRERIREQRELIDRKETFGDAMGRLHDSITPLAGLPFAELVPWDDYDALAAQAHAQRWNASAMDARIADAEAAIAELDERTAAAAAQAAGNASGSVWEATLDALGSGWVTTLLDDASAFCDGDPLACVLGNDPLVVHVDVEGDRDESMTDWIRTGVAYHEFAHVLQNLNPGPTETAAAAFGGDWETMADCYALTVLDGWTLDHVVWINDYQYWEVSVGYGYTCNEEQRQVIRDWTSQVGVVMQTIGG